jgi:hypothetical protein
MQVIAKPYLSSVSQTTLEGYTEQQIAVAFVKGRSGFFLDAAE